MNDSLGDRMKEYESVTDNRLMKRVPICVRLDGRAFHTFTRGLDRPYDAGFSRVMLNTAKALVREFHAKIGYTQSDEITLIFWKEGSEPLFGGRLFKLVSVLASAATGYFINEMPEYLPTKVGSIPTFDARVFTVPNLTEAANLLLWRWIDARKNSISMVAQCYFSSNQLHGLHQEQRLRMLKGEGVDWNDFDSRFKWGTFVRRESVQRTLSSEELDKIPEPHRPTGPVTRTEVTELDLGSFIDIENRVDVLFSGAKPIRAEVASV